MEKKLRKLAEDIFNLAYVPIWGLEDKELRIQQYEQILQEVYDDAQQSMLVISGDPIFRGVELGQMTDRQWQEMQEYFTGGKQKPQFDAENNSTKPPWRTLVLRYNDGQDKTLQIWVNTSKPFSLQIDDVNIPLEPMQPQFDAEKVKKLIIAYGKYHTACANEKSFTPDICATMQTTYYKLLAALHIEDES